MQALLHPNLGGKLWQQLKKDEKLMPTWDKLGATKFWTEDLWKAQRQVLAGETRRPRVQQEEVPLGDDTVRQEEVTLPSGHTRHITWGPLRGVLQAMPANVIWAECDEEDGAPQAVLQAMADFKDLHLVATGTPKAVDVALQKATEAGTFHDCTVSSVSVFMTDDPALGSKEPLETNAERRALLVTRSQFGNQREHLNYVVMHTRWRPSLLAYLIDLVGADRSSGTTVAFVPYPGRRDEDAVQMIGWLTAALPSVHFNFQPVRGEMHHAMVSKMLTESITKHLGQEELTNREVHVMFDGLTVSRADWMKTREELVQERKTAIKNANMEAKALALEEMSREEFQAVTSQEVMAGTQSTLLPFKRTSSSESPSQQVKTPSKQKGTPVPRKVATSARQREADAKRKARDIEEEASRKKVSRSLSEDPQYEPPGAALCRRSPSKLLDAMLASLFPLKLRRPGRICCWRSQGRQRTPPRIRRVTAAC